MQQTITRVSIISCENNKSKKRFIFILFIFFHFIYFPLTKQKDESKKKITEYIRNL